MPAVLYVNKLAQTYRGPSHEIYFDLTINGTYDIGGVVFRESDFSISQRLVAMSFYYHPQYHLFWDSEKYPYRIAIVDRATMQELPDGTVLNNLKVKGKITSAAL